MNILSFLFVFALVVFLLSALLKTIIDTKANPNDPKQPAHTNTLNSTGTTVLPPIRPSIRVVVGSPDDRKVKVKRLRYFCVKDKGYHVSVWPKDFYQFDVVEFSIAGLKHRTGIDNYLGEFKGTLDAEPTNPYDPNAIKVLAPDGHHVGYVPKDLINQIRDNAELPCPCFCYIGKNNGTYFSECYIMSKYA
jgi:hypothetical protein